MIILKLIIISNYGIEKNSLIKTIIQKSDNLNSCTKLKYMMKFGTSQNFYLAHKSLWLRQSFYVKSLDYEMSYISQTKDWAVNNHKYQWLGARRWIVNLFLLMTEKISAKILRSSRYTIKQKVYYRYNKQSYINTKLSLISQNIFSNKLSH